MANFLEFECTNEFKEMSFVHVEPTNSHCPPPQTLEESDWETVLSKTTSSVEGQRAVARPAEHSVG